MPLTAEQLHRMEQNKLAALERKRKREEEEAELKRKAEANQATAHRQAAHGAPTRDPAVLEANAAVPPSSMSLSFSSPSPSAASPGPGQPTHLSNNNDVQTGFSPNDAKIRAGEASDAQMYEQDMQEMREMMMDEKKRKLEQQSLSQSSMTGFFQPKNDPKKENKDPGEPRTAKVERPSAAIAAAMAALGGAADASPEAKVERQPVAQAALDSAEIKLSAEQQNVVDQAMAGKSIFITGCGGTGKSFLMHTVIKMLQQKFKSKNGPVAVTATTGIAATHIGGVSLHNFAGIGLGQGTVEQLVTRIRGKKESNLKWQRVQVLVVDEVSMLDADLFDKIEQIARKLKNKPAPFGGIQLLLVGDFLQLPPVSKGGNPKFCFEAQKWSKCVNLHVELKEVFRQSDKAFVSALNSIRWGKVTPEVTAMLTEASKTTFDPNSDIKPTMLYPMNAQIDQINSDKLRALSTPSHSFTSEDRGDQLFLDQLDKNCQAPKVLEVKVGAQVMLLKNTHCKDFGLCNGSRGVVRGFRKLENEQGEKCDVIDCEFETSGGDGGTVNVAIDREDFTLNSQGKEVAKRHQFPLRLAYAITIHKCQGMTLSKVEMSLKNVFEHGQAYVALSRASSLKGLRVLSWAPNVIKAHPKVINFYSNMGATPPRESTAAAAQTSLGTVDASCGKAGGAHIQATPVVARVNPLFCDDE